MAEEERFDRLREDVRLIYGLSGASTNFLKAQQWTATYYVFIVYGGILAYANLFNHFDSDPNTHGLRGCEVAALISLSVASAVTGIWYLRQAQNYIRRYRDDVKRMAESLSLGRKYPLPLGLCTGLETLALDTGALGQPFGFRRHPLLFSFPFLHFP